MELYGIDVRRLMHESAPLLDRIYVAVRDQDWGTVPPVVSEVEFGGDLSQPTRVTFLARHRQGDLAFSWRGSIALDTDGVLTYEMDGIAEEAFRYARIGICVLHPADTWAGSAYTAETADGRIEGHLPTLIGPQRIVDGHEQALFAPFTSLTLKRQETVLQLAFEGDLFETEDQRNWTDDSFKTYSTPLALGYPHDASSGRRIRQRVTVVTRRRATHPITQRAGAVELQPGAALDSWPAIGLGASNDHRPLGARELLLLRLIRPDHLRVDVNLADADWPTRLRSARADAELLDAALELACYVPAGDDSQLSELAIALNGARVARVLVFDDPATGAGPTPRALVRTVRERLSSAVPDAHWIAGTDGDFVGLNRDRPDLADLDGLCWSMNPQVHASDELSMAETVRGQAMTVATARDFAGAADLVVSPVTLRRRFDPASKGPVASTPPLTRPAAVDSRQTSLFAAAWTLGSLASLIGAGASTITYFETAGWRGLMEWADPPERPGWPDWTCGRVFPVYHVFTDLGDRASGRPVPIRSSNRDVVAIGIESTARTTALVANLRPVEVTCELAVRTPSRAHVRMLDVRSALMAMDEPMRFREQSKPADTARGVVRCVLGPYAMARVDVEDVAHGG
jgi:hypothetical protein